MCVKRRMVHAVSFRREEVKEQKKQHRGPTLRCSSAGAVTADSRGMDSGIGEGCRLSRKYPWGCACTFRTTERVANGRRMALRNDLIVKAVMPPSEPVSSSDDRIMSAAKVPVDSERGTRFQDESGTREERINRAGDFSGGRRKDSEAKERRRPRHAALTDISCGRKQPKSTGSHGLGLGLGCGSVTELDNESIINAWRSVRTKESAEAVVNQKFIHGENSKQFMEALYILNSNKTLFVKLLEDPNSFLAKHIQELRVSGKNGRKFEAVSKAETARTGGKDEGAGTLSPRKSKIWEKLLLRRGAEKDKSCEIVILKPGLENEREGGNQGSYFASGGGTGNGIRAVRQSRIPFGSLWKTSKQRMGGNHEHSGGNEVKGIEAMKPAVTQCYERKELDRESFVRRLSREDQVKVLSNFSLAEIAPVDDFTSMEPDDQRHLPGIVAELTNVARMPKVMLTGKYNTSIERSSQMHSQASHTPDFFTSKIDELERVETAGRFLWDACRDQTALSSSDDSFCNSTEESNNSAMEEHESPISVLEHHVASPINTPSRPERATSNMPPDKFARAAEFVKSILISSDLTWDTVLPNYDSLNQLLGDTGLSLHHSGIDDTRLLHDYASEVLQEAVIHRWRSYQRGHAVNGGDVPSEVMKEVDWDLVLPQAQLPFTLERTVSRELMKSRTPWMQLGMEIDDFVVKLAEMIIEDVVDEIP